ncbi:hypothetical protein PFLUV_G00146330 [Perca fluviatilis]|uniref:Immunoglobulin V-set domain-containing protein n=1 Tax=Perca fluviatilis TaxID=8168 RepID=A0A6A5EW94_PERFL|nr:hypothetical protein PFLUV_G00146330 [Perca fluviatilis]
MRTFLGALLVVTLIVSGDGETMLEDKDDQGKYRCSFRKQEEYQYFFVYLNVSACYTVCQTLQGGSVNFHQCYVKKRYRETEIQWIVGGQLLTESNTTNINKTYTMDASTGLYHFNSTLKWTVDPTCHTNRIPTNTEPNKGDPDSARYRYLTIIPILLVLGLSLLLWRRWDTQSS